MNWKFSTSYFDDLKPKEKFWKKQLYSIEDKKIEFQCLLFKKNSKTGFWMSKNYVIYESQLIKIKPHSSKCHIVNLNLSRIEQVKYQNKLEKEIINKKKYGFRLIRNTEFREFYSRSKEQNSLLWDKLKKEAFLSQFTESYTLKKMIGRGNFAKVYQSVSKQNQKLYAVKIFEKDKMKNSEIDKKALLKEINIMRKLNHQGVIKLHEVFEDETNIYFVLDYLEGGELYNHIQNNYKFPEKLVAKVIATILNSLDYLQQQNILHRDLKPENMILRNKGILDDIVITDFGLADYYSNQGNYLFSRCGTPGYVAPEVLHDELYDFKIDVFSVGCLMYILLAGKSPFKGQKYDDIVMKNYHCQVDYKNIENQISSEGLALLKQLLHPNPKIRPVSRIALKNVWFQINLEQSRYYQLNCHQSDIKKLPIKSSLSNITQLGFNSNLKSNSDARTFQNNKQSIEDKDNLIKSAEIRNQPTAQYDDINSLKGLNNSENYIVMDDDESHLFHSLIQYQIKNKCKQTLDFQNFSHINNSYTNQNNFKQYEDENQKEKFIIRKFSNKVMSNLNSLESQQ
ncbi:unnamed protein product [Paramecium sonneborni]|uniref:Protein kinase domain-containing protein n=1 Tax=Paramecium sonneborni TaxID=65129 RepID=A0A8S1L6Q0_9CILI|nr:unnamed protein product [Paramecium sonneborni]